MQCTNTFRSERELGLDLTARTNTSSGWLRSKRPLHCIICEWGKTRAPLCFLPKWCGSCGEIFWEWRNPPLRVSKWRNERVFPGHFFPLSLSRSLSLSPLETELQKLFSVNLLLLFLMSRCNRNVAVCPTDTLIRHHARAGFQFANPLISHNAFMKLISRQLTRVWVRKAH